MLGISSFPTFLGGEHLSFLCPGEIELSLLDTVVDVSLNASHEYVPGQTLVCVTQHAGSSTLHPLSSNYTLFLPLPTDHSLPTSLASPAQGIRTVLLPIFQPFSLVLLIITETNGHITSKTEWGL